uniref:Uncharacterized protein n=1 Tax=Timema poppense TaxID=170557 RepID=A0A7R9D7Y5_TIMPO|nr:unnamed protein product [Timema poppensis]
MSLAEDQRTKNNINKDKENSLQPSYLIPCVIIVLTAWYIKCRPIQNSKMKNQVSWLTNLTLHHDTKRYKNKKNLKDHNQFNEKNLNIKKLVIVNNNVKKTNKCDIVNQSMVFLQTIIKDENNYLSKTIAMFTSKRNKRNTNAYTSLPVQNTLKSIIKKTYMVGANTPVTLCHLYNHPSHEAIRFDNFPPNPPSLLSIPGVTCPCRMCCGSSLFPGSPRQPMSSSMGIEYTSGAANDNKGFTVFPIPEF